MQGILKLQHHRHTAKRLPHKHTSYRSLFLVIVILGLSISAIQTASADTLEVTASIPAPIPTQPAEITSPSNNTISSKSIVRVSGVCEKLSPSYSVSLLRGSDFLGSTFCQSNGTFEIYITLIAGDNFIHSETTTITDGKGPKSQTVLIRYQPPGSGFTNTGLNNGLPTPGPKLKIISLRQIIYTPKKSFNVNYEITGGQAPYQLTVKWGDGSSSETFTVQGPGSGVLAHTYQASGPFMVSIDLVDKNQQRDHINLAALSFRKPLSIIPFSGGPTKTSDFFASDTHKYVWLAYVLIIVAVSSFWLGEVYQRKVNIGNKTKYFTQKKTR